MLTYIKQLAPSNCNIGTHIMWEAGRRLGTRRIFGAVWAEGVKK